MAKFFLIKRLPNQGVLLHGRAELCHRAITYWSNCVSPEMKQYIFKGCWSPTPLVVNKLENIWQ